MSTPFVDPRQPDPRFPDRPTHEDFVLLSTVVQEHDAKIEDKDFDFQRYVSETVDLPSVAYMAQQRVQMLVGQMNLPSHPMLIGALEAVFIDGLVIGAKYQEERG